jgi:HD-like signal output (HDOD) protein
MGRITTLIGRNDSLKGRADSVVEQNDPLKERGESLVGQNDSLLDRINGVIESGKVNLPICNPAIFPLHKALADDSTDVGEIEKLIMTDQTLAAEILRAANSPFYCGLSSVRTIRNAIVRLGLQQVQRLMIMALEHAKYRAQSEDLDVLLKNLWIHASTSALAAQWLAQRIRMPDIEDVCFLGGLLHDFGKLIILRAVDEIKKSENREFAVSPELLNEILTTTHCQIGYKLLQTWNLPDDYCCAARDHHLSEFSADNTVLAIVRLANESSRKLGLGLDPNPDLVLSATPEAGLLKISELTLAELEVMLEDHIASAA